MVLHLLLVVREEPVDDKLLLHIARGNQLLEGPLQLRKLMLEIEHMRAVQVFHYIRRSA